MKNANAKYRKQLPQLNGGTFLTDGGLETSLIFHSGLELPHFAAFDLLKDEAGRQTLYDYFINYIKLACKNKTGFILESATWRANIDWARKLGYDEQGLIEANQRAIALLAKIRQQFEVAESPMVISGCIGPRGDGYKATELMSITQARQYHSAQLNTFRNTEVDMVSAITMTNIEEATGIALAAKDAGLPCVISFTVETDGRLPGGQSLKQAIEKVDAETDASPVYYMINCAHPDHFKEVLACDANWLQRIYGVRANASNKSHAELDEAEQLDDGNPEELGMLYALLKVRLKNLSILGGCCGTDHRHVEQMCHACVA